MPKTDRQSFQATYIKFILVGWWVLTNFLAVNSWPISLLSNVRSLAQGIFRLLTPQGNSLLQFCEHLVLTIVKQWNWCWTSWLALELQNSAGNTMRWWCRPARQDARDVERHPTGAAIRTPLHRAQKQPENALQSGLCFPELWDISPFYSARSCKLKQVASSVPNTLSWSQTNINSINQHRTQGKKDLIWIISYWEHVTL